MMNPTSKNLTFNLAPGTIIKGKWHGNTFHIIRSLGYGATGEVYLARGTSGDVALKISGDSMAITSEVNVLKHFSKVQGTSLGPSLIDVDDWEARQFSKVISFYVMEYLDGYDVFSFIQKKGEEWVGVFLLQLLKDLERLHSEGWVFGDLKPENLLITGPPPKIRWLDVGGTTMIGRSIKEYTEFFDRGYWGLGSRKAEPSYDLFSVGMVLLNIAYPKRFNKTQEDPIIYLNQKIQSSTWLGKYESVINHALQGKYKNAQEMRSEVIKNFNPTKMKPNDVSIRKDYRTSLNKHEPPPSSNKFKGVLETFFIGTVLLLGYVFYLYLNV